MNIRFLWFWYLWDRPAVPCMSVWACHQWCTGGSSPPPPGLWAARSPAHSQTYPFHILLRLSRCSPAGRSDCTSVYFLLSVAFISASSFFIKLPLSTFSIKRQPQSNPNIFKWSITASAGGCASVLPGSLCHLLLSCIRCWRPKAEGCIQSQSWGPPLHMSEISKRHQSLKY